ncbi:MAG: hypothetical protein NVSMB13_14940 [Mycobacteriales bacterium]
MALRDELAVVRRSVADAESAVAAIRRCAADARLVGRLEADVRRLREDVDDLEAGLGPAEAEAAPPQRVGGGIPGDAGLVAEPIPLPPADYPMERLEDCDDEGLGVSWHSSGVRHDRGRR